MIERNPNPTLPQCGTANQAHIERALDQLAAEFDLATLSRRGRLYIVSSGVDESVPANIYRQYYASSKFDPMRNLSQVIAAQDSDSQAAVAGALIHNMTLYTAGTTQARVWVWRNKRLFQVLPSPKGEAVGIPDDVVRIAGRVPTCNCDQRRLYPGDCVILTDASSDHKMSTRLLHRAAMYAASSDSFAKSLAQVLRSAQFSHPVVTVIQLPGSAATPELPPQSQIQYAYSGAADFAPRARVSPILLAAIIALVAILLAVIINKPKISESLLRDIFIGTPMPTETIQANQSVTPGAEAAATATLQPAD
ncbi:MAG: hypothetical protein ACYC6L_13020 [Anaerolineae bacterium]